MFSPTNNPYSKQFVEDDNGIFNGTQKNKTQQYLQKDQEEDHESQESEKSFLQKKFVQKNKENRETDGEEKFITIEEAVTETGNKGMGIFQVITAIALTLIAVSQTIIFSFFSFITHEPDLFCINEEGNSIKCSTDDYCGNDTYVDYEIDWSKDSNDGTLKNWVTEYELICDQDWYLDLVTSLYFAGTVISAIGANYFAELFGRKPILTIAMIIQVLSFLLVIIGTWDKSSLSISMFMMGTTFSAQFQVTTVYIVEMTSMEYKSTLSNILQMGLYVWYFVILGILFVWRDCIIAEWVSFALSVSLLLFLVFFLPESPRFLYSKSRIEETVQVLNFMKLINGRPIVPIHLSPNEINKVKNLNEEIEVIVKEEIEYSDEGIEKKKKTKSNSYLSFLQLFSNKRAINSTIFVCLLFGIDNLLFYGVSVNADDLDGSLFTVITIFGIASLMGTGIVTVFVETMKRKTFYCGASLLVSLSFTCYYLFSSTSSLVSVACLLIAITSANVLFSLIYLITAEIFPTTVRSSAFGLTNVVGKMFAFVVPYLDQIFGDYTIIFYISSGIVSFVITIFLEETKGKPLKETWNDVHPTTVECELVDEDDEDQTQIEEDHQLISNDETNAPISNRKRISTTVKVNSHSDE